MSQLDMDAWIARSRPLDLSGIAWEDVPCHPLSADALRILHFMQAVESHTIVFPRTIFTRRAVDDPVVSTFFVLWLYEETFHGLALEKFLSAAGHPVGPHHGHRESAADRREAVLTAALSRVWPSFLALHMTWGAIHELTTLTGYRRLARLAGHPVLEELLGRIVRDESRHLAFYAHQAETRLAARPKTARLIRAVIDRLYKPVGHGVRPIEELRFVTRHLFGGAEGAAAARQVDETIGRLPGFAGARTFQRWVESVRPA